MNVTIVRTNHPDHPITKPFPPANRFGCGLLIRWVAGDRYDPHVIAKDWYSPPWPVDYVRERIPEDEPMLYFAWRLWGWSGYIGAKVYGFDLPEYRNFPGVTTEDVYEGSQAFCLTVRPFARSEP